MRFFIFLLASFFIIACSHSGRNPQLRNIDDNSPQSVAFDLMKKGRPFNEYMEEQLKAVKQIRDGNPQSDPVEILSQTAWFYSRNGKFPEALEYLQEASDSLKLRRKNGAHSQADAIRVFGNQAALYSMLGMSEEALDANANAIAVSADCGYTDASDLWRMRGSVFADMLPSATSAKPIVDSINYCFDMSLHALSLMPPSSNFEELRRIIYREKGNILIEKHEWFPDSVDAGLGLLRKARVDDSSDLMSIDAVIGRALVIKGDGKNGIPLIEKARDSFKKQGWLQAEAWTLDLLANSYSETGNAEKLIRIFPEFVAAHDSLSNQGMFYKLTY